jgi:hypothetical protein
MKRPRVEDGWNGASGREVRGNHHDEESYCVRCGDVMVFQSGRQCPSCVNKQTINELEERVENQEERIERLEAIVDAIDDRPPFMRADEIEEGQKFEGVVVNCEPVILDNGADTLTLRTSSLDVELGDGVRARSTVHGYETAVVDPDEIEMKTPNDEDDR